MNKKNKEITIKIVKIFLFSIGVNLMLFIFLMVYVSAYFKGYLDAKTRDYKRFNTSFLSLVNKTAMGELQNTTPTPSVRQISPSLSPKTTPETKKVTWGGPDLWMAVNRRREELGVNSLSTSSNLCTIASIRLNELLELGKLDGHEGFTSFTQRRPDLEWIFGEYSNISEFLAYGGESAEETVSLWENTLGHKKLLTGGEYVWGCIYAQNTFAVAITAY